MAVEQRMDYHTALDRVADAARKVKIDPQRCHRKFRTSVHEAGKGRVGHIQRGADSLTMQRLLDCFGPDQLYAEMMYPPSRVGWMFVPRASPRVSRKFKFH